MIAALIFLAHLIAAVYAFLKYRREGVGEALLAVAFVVIIFSVGWTLTTMVAKIIFPSELAARWISGMQDSSFSRALAKELTIDTLALLLLVVSEGFFYYFYLRSETKGHRRTADREVK
jgi:hypothetical protein